MGAKKDNGVRIWLRREVYEKYKALKPEGMGDNQFMVYLLNLYEKTGKTQLEEIWKLLSLSGISDSRESIPSSTVPENSNDNEVSSSAPDFKNLEGWDV